MDMLHFFFIHLSTLGHLGCLHIFVTVNWMSLYLIECSCPHAFSAFAFINCSNESFALVWIEGVDKKTELFHSTRSWKYGIQRT